METDSLILVRKVKSRTSNVPRRLKTRWKRCLNALYSSTFITFHIFSGGNIVVDVMANIGFSLSLSDFNWWYGVPHEANIAYISNLRSVTEY